MANDFNGSITFMNFGSEQKYPGEMGINEDLFKKSDSLMKGTMFSVGGQSNANNTSCNNSIIMLRSESNGQQQSPLST